MADDLQTAFWSHRVYIFLITAGDVQLLPKMLDAAHRFEARPSDAEMAAVAADFVTEPIFA